MDYFYSLKDKASELYDDAKEKAIDMKEYADEMKEYYDNPEKLKEKAKDVAIQKSKEYVQESIKKGIETAKESYENFDTSLYTNPIYLKNVYKFGLSLNFNPSTKEIANWSLFFLSSIGLSPLPQWVTYIGPAKIIHNKYREYYESEQTKNKYNYSDLLKQLDDETEHYRTITIKLIVCFLKELKLNDITETVNKIENNFFPNGKEDFSGKKFNGKTIHNVQTFLNSQLQFNMDITKSKYLLNYIEYQSIISNGFLNLIHQIIHDLGLESKFYTIVLFEPTPSIYRVYRNIVDKFKN